MVTRFLGLLPYTLYIIQGKYRFVPFPSFYIYYTIPHTSMSSIFVQIDRKIYRPGIYQLFPAIQASVK